MEPKITFGFGEPTIVGNLYVLPVTALSDTPGVELFGINLRFAYESAKFGSKVNVTNLQGGWGLPWGQPPVFTGTDGSKIILGFTSAPRWVNGNLQLTDPTAPKIMLDSVTPKRLFDIALQILPGADVSCPSFVWEKMKLPLQGGFLGGSDGLTATKVKTLIGSNYTTESTTEIGAHKNWAYTTPIVRGKFPYGSPKPC